MSAMSGFSLNTGAAAKIDNDSKQYVHHLANMIHSEPIVNRCIEVISSNVFMKGLTVRTNDGRQFATAPFREFVNEHYVAFAKDAIRMFLLVGFVVWHISKKTVHGVVQRVPEIFPLGTFTWTVRKNDGSARVGEKRKKPPESILYYDVTLVGLDCEFSVFEFCKPDMTMQCVSPVSTVIASYIRLQVTRACKMRCEEWNASVHVAIEMNEKVQMNQLSDDGTVLQGAASNTYFENVFEDSLTDSTDQRAQVIRQQTQMAGLPGNTHVFVLPKNHVLRPMDHVEPPAGSPENEIEFQRYVASNGICLHACCMI
jgi:hypothetical protein